MLPLLAYASWHAADTGPLRPHAGGRLVPVRARGRDRRLWRRGRPGRRTPAVRPQRARPPRGRGVPHLERRRPGAPHVRRDELATPTGRRARTMRCAASRGRSSATAPGRYARARPGRLPALLHARGACSRGNSDLAVALPQFGRLVRRNEIARDRWFPGFVPARAARRPNGCATTTSGSTSRGR